MKLNPYANAVPEVAQGYNVFRLSMNVAELPICTYATDSNSNCTVALMGRHLRTTAWLQREARATGPSTRDTRSGIAL